MDDSKLISRYLTEQSDSAFAAIMERHRRLVYSTCLRELGDVSLAEDATQVVFIILARKARSLRREVVLSGWLFKTARFTAMDIKRLKARQLQQLSVLTRQVELSSDSEQAALWNKIDPELNDCINRLASKDREAVLLRCFDQLTFPEIGETLGISEEGARHRVDRALEKMRKILASNGVAVPVAVLGGLLIDNALKPESAKASLPPNQVKQNAESSSLHTSLNQIAQGVLTAMLIKQLTTAAIASIAIVASITVGASLVRAQDTTLPIKLVAANPLNQVYYAIFPNNLMTEVWAENTDGSNRRRVATVTGQAGDSGPWISDAPCLQISAAPLTWSWSTWNDTTKTLQSSTSSMPIVDTDLQCEFLIDKADGKVTRLTVPTNYRPLYMVPSPDNSRVAFNGSFVPPDLQDDPLSWQSGVWQTDNSTGKTTLLLAGNIKTAPAWSPDGSHVIIGDGQGYTTNYDLKIVDVKTGKIWDLGINGDGASFSPDGTRITYCGGDFHTSGAGSWDRGVPTSGSVFTLTLKPGSSPIQLSSPKDQTISPIWSPDGTRIAYISSGRRVCVAAADGTSNAVVYDSGEQPISSISWDSTGKSIYVNAGPYGMMTAYSAPATGQGKPLLLPVSADRSSLTKDANQQTIDAQSKLVAGITMYAFGQIRLFEANITSARKAWQLSATDFLQASAAEPMSALTTLDVSHYSDKVTALTSESDDQLLQDSCKQRMEFLAVVVAGAVRGKKMPSNLTAALSLASSESGSINWLNSSDQAHRALLANCPGTSTSRPEAYIYLVHPDRSLPQIGEVFLKCPLHPEDKETWSKMDQWMVSH